MVWIMGLAEFFDAAIFDHLDQEIK